MRRLLAFCLLVVLLFVSSVSHASQPIYSSDEEIWESLRKYPYDLIDEAKNTYGSSMSVIHVPFAIEENTSGVFWSVSNKNEKFDVIYGLPDETYVFSGIEPNDEIFIISRVLGFFGGLLFRAKELDIQYELHWCSTEHTANRMLKINEKNYKQYQAEYNFKGYTYDDKHESGVEQSADTFTPEPTIIYSVSIEKEFSLGDRSIVVYDAKKQLAKLGYLSSADVKDDSFSRDLMETVKRFQKDNDIYADGKLSIETQIKLFGEMGVLHTPTPKPSPTPTKKVVSENPTPSPTPKVKGTYSIGKVNREIGEIKKRLAKLGYFVDDKTDKFTSELAEAIKAFQKDYGLSVNGAANAETQNTLLYVVSKSFPVGYKHNYKLGDEGEDVKNIKLELQKYGYYRYNSTFDGEYNSTMVDRVKLFQQTNDLEVTGEIDENMLLLLFNGKPKKTNEYATATPRPTATPQKEPKYALQQTSYAKWAISSGVPWFSVQVKNTSEKKTVDGVTVEYYATDVYGNQMKGWGWDNIVYKEIINTNIRPGGTVYLERIYAYPFENAKRIYHRIDKIHFTDGTSVTYPQFDEGKYWYIEYEY